MGCDIHMTYQKISKAQKRERKLSNIFEDNIVDVNEVDKWEYIGNGPKVNGYQFCEEWRNYYWFGRMSEVRSYGPRITTEGFPEGTKESDSGGDHSHCHVYLDRLLEEKWTKEDKEHMYNFITEDIGRMVQYCNDSGLNANEFRILISYDS